MRVRRSPHLVVFWRRGALVATNFATRDTSTVTPFICQLLDACEGLDHGSAPGGAARDAG